MVSASLQMNQQTIEKLRQFRRLLHRHPELSLEEYETTKRIQEILQNHDIELLSHPLSTGALALVKGQYPGPCVAIRADIDALPINEETKLPYKSEIEGKMHACGHDFHTACVLGAALLAKELADSETSFAGSILFIFQPAEELGVGARLVLNSGVLNDLNVKAIIGEHNNPLLETGKIGVKPGPLMGSVDEFKITVQGKGGHAAIPDLTVDPILIASQVVAGLQHIVSRHLSPLTSAVVTVGQFHSGTAANVIPMEAVLEGTVRALEPENRDKVEERLRDFVEQTVASYGGSVTIEYEQQLPAVVNDPAISKIVRDAAISVLGEDSVVEASPTLAGEDFAVYQKELPGCFFWVGTGKPDGSSEGWHHPQFDVDEAMIEVTSQVFVKAALGMLEHFTSC